MHLTHSEGSSGFLRLYRDDNAFLKIIGRKFRRDAKGRQLVRGTNAVSGSANRGAPVSTLANVGAALILILALGSIRLAGISSQSRIVASTEVWS
jgi:hypothetical protein